MMATAADMFLWATGFAVWLGLAIFMIVRSTRWLWSRLVEAMGLAYYRRHRQEAEVLRRLAIQDVEDGVERSR